jgi:hypothetical protein
MLINTDPLLWLFLIFMAASLGGPALYALLYLFAHTLIWLFLIVDQEQPVEIQLETIGEISS